MAYKDYLKQEEKMREAASLARAEKNKILERTGEEPEEGKRRPAPDLTEEEEEAKKERDTFRYINKREQERERRLEVIRNFLEQISLPISRSPEVKNPRLQEMPKEMSLKRLLWAKLSLPFQRKACTIKDFSIRLQAWNP